MIKLRHDSRSKRWSVSKTFGQVSIQDFPLEYSVRETFPDYIQPIGDVRCTAITCCDIASDKDGVQYDIDDLFNRVVSDQNGAVPQDVLSEVVKNGLLPVGQTQRIKVFSSFYEPHSGNYDAFDNVRSAFLKMEQVNGKGYPIAVYTNWYREWMGQLLLVGGKIKSSGHMYDISGWKQENGEPVLLKVSAWLPYKPTIGREEFNKAVSAWGCGTAVLSTLFADNSKKKTILEGIKDAIINLYLATIELLQNEVKKKSMNKGQQVYDIAMEHKGEYLTLDTSVPKQFNCCECMSWIFKEAGLPIPKYGIASTIMMNDWLSKNATQIDTPELGDIIIFITQVNNHGHIFINGKNAMLSNDSDTGTLQSYWTLSGAIKFYHDQKRLKMKAYRF